jgi:hypothetical protein
MEILEISQSHSLSWCVFQHPQFQWPALSCVCFCSALWQSIWRTLTPTPTWRGAARLRRHPVQEPLAKKTQHTHDWLYEKKTKDYWKTLAANADAGRNSKICQCWKLIMFFIHHLALLQQQQQQKWRWRRRWRHNCTVSLEFSLYNLSLFNSLFL